MSSNSPDGDDNYDEILAGLKKEKNKDVLKISPLARGRLKNWILRNKHSRADSRELEAYLNEALKGGFGDYTVAGAISALEESYKLNEAGESSNDLTRLATMIDWQKIREREQALEQIAEQVQPVREMLEELRKSGFLTAEKEREILGLEQRAPRLPTRAKQQFEDEIAKLTAQRDKFKELSQNFTVPKPTWKIGDRVIYVGTGLVAEISDMGYNPQTKKWTYTVKNPEGIEYIVDYPERELSAAPALMPVATPLPAQAQAPLEKPLNYTPEIQNYVRQKAQENFFSQAEERQLFNVVSPRRTLEQNRVAVDEEIKLVLRQKQQQEPVPQKPAEEFQLQLKEGKRPGTLEVNVVPVTSTSRTMRDYYKQVEFQIDRRLVPIEQRMLLLEGFRYSQDNYNYLILSKEERAKLGLPVSLRAFAEWLLKLNMIKLRDLAQVGIISLEMLPD